MSIIDSGIKWKSIAEVLLEAGEYVVLGPEDVHKPRCLAGEAMEVVKIVVKVPV